MRENAKDTTLELAIEKSKQYPDAQAILEHKPCMGGVVLTGRSWELTVESTTAQDGEEKR